MVLMHKSSMQLGSLLQRLTDEARRLGLTDTEWARRAELRKETLSRLRRRDTCDLATLQALAAVVGAQLGVTEFVWPESTPDGHFPQGINRNYEERLVALCSSDSLDVARWASAGPRFFMAGLAVMLASVPGRDRRGLLALAEQLHPGASDPAVFARWLERSPLRPTRFLPLLDVAVKHAA
jgi:hypothetical protein